MRSAVATKAIFNQVQRLDRWVLVPPCGVVLCVKRAANQFDWRPIKCLASEYFIRLLNDLNDTDICGKLATASECIELENEMETNRIRKICGGDTMR